MLITLQPDKVLLMRARPHRSDPSKCYWDKITLVMPPAEDAEIVADLQFMPKPKPVPEERPEREEFTQEDVIAGKKRWTSPLIRMCTSSEMSKMGCVQEDSKNRF